MADGLTLQVDDETARRLRERAEKDGLSVEEEARRLLGQALRNWDVFWAKADRIRTSLAGRTFQDSAELIRVVLARTGIRRRFETSSGKVPETTRVRVLLPTLPVGLLRAAEETDFP